MEQEYNFPHGYVPRTIDGVCIPKSTMDIVNKQLMTLKIKPHAHYFKDVSHLDTIDVYRVLELFSVTNSSIAHAVKKLLVAGGRGAGKDIDKDIQEAIDSLVRWQAMQEEDKHG